MNIEISVIVPKASDAKSYTSETEVQRISNPMVVRAVLLAIIACEAEAAAAEGADKAAGLTTEPAIPDVTGEDVTNNPA